MLLPTIGLCHISLICICHGLWLFAAGGEEGRTETGVQEQFFPLPSERSGGQDKNGTPRTSVLGCPAALRDAGEGRSHA